MIMKFRMKFPWMKVILLLLKLWNVFSEYVEIQRSFQFETVLRSDQEVSWVWRSEASKLKTLRLVDFDRRFRIDIKLCIEPVKGADIVSIIIDDIRYANDGPDDYIFVTFEGEDWYVFSTYEKWAHGHEWNIFRNTGRVSEKKYLKKGEYIISVSAVTDKWGLELDKIRIIAEYQKLNSTLFCGGRLVDTYTDNVTDFIDLKSENKQY